MQSRLRVEPKQEAASLPVRKFSVSNYGHALLGWAVGLLTYRLMSLLSVNGWASIRPF